MVKVIGHRGDCENPEIDENSAEAFAEGIRVADGIETDVVLSMGGQTAFLIHQALQRSVPFFLHFIPSLHLDSLKDHFDKKSAKLVGARHFEQMPDSDIEALRLKKGAKVPRFSALFNLASQHPEKTFDIELKGAGVVERVLQEIEEAVAEGKIRKEQIILTSFDPDAIQRAKQLDPSVKCGLIFSQLRWGNFRIYSEGGHKGSCYVRFNPKALRSKTVKDINPDFFIVKSAFVNAKAIKWLRELFPKAKVMLFTPGEKPPKQDSKVLKLLKDPKTADAVEAVITDYPGQMANQLRGLSLSY